MYNTIEKCKELAEKFKQICAERGTTPYKIAQKSGLSSSTVSCFQAATTVPRVDTLMILCNQLGISVSDFFGEREVSQTQTEDEENILKMYRNLPEDRKMALRTYLKMLNQYQEE